MFESPFDRSSRLTAALRMMGAIYETIVWQVRGNHRNAFMAIGLNILTMLIMIGVFFALMSFIGLRAVSIRGDFLLYVMSGIFMFQCNNMAISATAGAQSTNSNMLQHAPLNTAVVIVAAVLNTLYIQTISVIVILSAYSLLTEPVQIEQPIMAYAMLVLSILCGACLGMVFLALKPWLPTLTGNLQTIYLRLNMISSGKMFVANTLPSFMLAMFDWNPLFHIIDQGRGYIFINYFPQRTNLEYPIYLSLILLMIGLIGEHYTRNRVSVSWTAGR